MSDPSIPESNATTGSGETFGDLLSRYEKDRSRKPGEGAQGLQGTVIAVSADSVILDIGYKTEGVLPLTSFLGAGEEVKPGDKLAVSIRGRNAEGYYELSRGRISRPRD